MEERREVVAFLGPKASYTHQAALSQFPEARYELRAAASIEAVFAAVQSGDASAGVVPFENSTNGPVVFTLDLLADRRFTPGMLVVGEIYLRVRHCLLGHAPRSNTTGQPRDAEFAHVKTVYSHPQAWGQCRRFLSAHLGGAERQDASSTSRAAELAAAAGLRSAAIASRLAAELHGLAVLADGIEDDAGGNTTRFFVVRRAGDAELPPPPPRDEAEAQDGDADESAAPEAYKTLVSFKVDDTVPGALARAVGVVAKHRLNLTSFNSRPSGDAPWHYVFFAEFYGRKSRDGHGGKVDRALTELSLAADMSWLGSWENRLAAR